MSNRTPQTSRRKSSHPMVRVVIILIALNAALVPLAVLFWAARYYFMWADLGLSAVAAVCYLPTPLGKR